MRIDVCLKTFVKTKFSQNFQHLWKVTIVMVMVFTVAHATTQWAYKTFNINRESQNIKLIGSIISKNSVDTDSTVVDWYTRKWVTCSYTYAVLRPWVNHGACNEVINRNWVQLSCSPVTFILGGESCIDDHVSLQVKRDAGVYNRCCRRHNDITRHQPYGRS